MKGVRCHHGISSCLNSYIQCRVAVPLTDVVKLEIKLACFISDNALFLSVTEVDEKKMRRKERYVKCVGLCRHHYLELKYQLCNDYIYDGWLLEF